MSNLSNLTNQEKIQEVQEKLKSIDTDTRRDLVAQLKDYQKKNQYRFYVPNLKAEAFIRMFAEEDKLINMFIGGNGTSKCLSLSAPILMADGTYKNLGDIIVGDDVIGVDYKTGIAKPTKVINTFRAGKKQLFKITFNDGGNVIASAEHEFPVRYRSGKTYATHGILKKVHTVKKKLAEIMSRPDVSISKKTRFIQPSVITFNQQSPLPINPYLVGALLGDGSINNKLGFTNADNEVIERVNSLLYKYGCKLSKKGIKPYHYSIAMIERARVNPFKKLIHDIGINVRCDQKFIPHIYKISSIQDRIELLAGLVDTDGSSEIFTSISEQLARDFAFVVRSLGGKATISERMASCWYKGEKRYSTCWSVYFRLNNALPLSLSHKQKTSKKPIDYTNRIVKSIEPYAIEECGDIEVEHEGHCFVSYDFVVTGNSTTLINLIANICWPNGNKFFDYPIFKNWPYLKAIRVVSDPETVQHKLVPDVVRWFPHGRYEKVKAGKNYYSIFNTDTNFIIQFNTYEQDIREFESVDLGLVCVDEPPPQKIFNALLSRLRGNGKAAVFFTPLAQASYMLDEYIESGDTSKKKITGIVFVDLWDNVVGKTNDGRDRRGFLTQNQAENMMSLYSKDELEARVHGKFMHLGGLIYPDFSRDRHVKGDFYRDKIYESWAEGSWEVSFAIDPHPVVNTAVLFQALLRDGRRVFIDEIWSGTETKKIAAEIYNKIQGFKKLGARINRIGLIDPSAVIRDKLRGNRSWKDDFEAEWRAMGSDIVLLEAPRDRDRGETIVKEELKGMVDPNMFVCSNLTQMIWEFGRYMKNPKDPTKRIDKNDHFMENMYRLVLAYPSARFNVAREQRRKRIIGIGT